MIKSFKHAGLEKFFLTESKAGIQPEHAKRLKDILGRLHVATAPKQMDIPGSWFHELQGDRTATWAVKVNGNWRVTFQFEDEDAILVGYEDYH